MINDDQIYVVVDIETDGPVAGLYSMLSIGVVATTNDDEAASFYRKIMPLEGASQEPFNMKWWEAQPEAWEEVTADARLANEVMNEFCQWVENLGKKPVFVAHPVGFDYAVVSWYLWKFVGKDPFTNDSGAPITLDLSSYIAGKYNLKLEDATRKRLPESLTQGMPKHSHSALDDARGFAVILRNVLGEE